MLSPSPSHRAISLSWFIELGSRCRGAPLSSSIVYLQTAADWHLHAGLVQQRNGPARPSVSVKHLNVDEKHSATTLQSLHSQCAFV
jgi:hypothetical protein